MAIDKFTNINFDHSGKKNTRFNPTANGSLHLGHIWMALINEQVAHASLGKFYVRFGDNQLDWILKLGKNQIESNCIQILEDLNWFRINIDGISYESKNANIIDQIQNHIIPKEITLNVEDSQDYNGLKYILPLSTYQYPFVPNITLHKVIEDKLLEINYLIRGDDLSSEYALYEYFRGKCGWSNINHWYLPRLKVMETEEISKTKGNFIIKDLRKQGYTAEQLIESLKKSTLVDPDLGFIPNNISPHPMIEIGES